MKRKQPSVEGKPAVIMNTWCDLGVKHPTTYDCQQPASRLNHRDAPQGKRQHTITARGHPAIQPTTITHGVTQNTPGGLC